jgi:hypothetical protein
MSLVKDTIKDYVSLIRGLLQTKETDMKKSTRVRKASEEDIRLLAYLKWELAQPTSKSSEEFWCEAEQELGVKKTEKEEK